MIDLAPATLDADAPPPTALVDSSYDLRSPLPLGLTDGLPRHALQRMAVRVLFGRALAKRMTPDWRHLAWTRGAP